MHVEASIDLDDVIASAMTSLTAFRLVQEAMTNSLQHAPGAPVWLTIRPDEDRARIRMTVENPMRETATRRRLGRRQGLGLTGMAERVRTAGGSLEVGPTPQGTWRISAELPLDRAKEPL